MGSPLNRVLGVVLSGQGQPVVGAEVSIVELGMTTTTGEDGRFTLDAVPAGSFELEVSRRGFVTHRQPLEVSAAAPESLADLEIVLAPALAEASDEISVTASYSLLRQTPTSSSVLTREEVQLAPHFGDDLYRAISILPGTATSDLSAGFTVRGGYQNEILVMLDGLELFEPFHLKEIQGGFFTILDPEVIGSLELISSGFGAKYGNRQTAVLDMTSTDWDPELRMRLAASFSNISIAAGGASSSGTTDWLASVRRGYLDILLEIEGEDDAPDIGYWDTFAKARRRPSETSSWTLSLLAAGDTFDYTEDDDEPFIGDSSYSNLSSWLRHQSLIAGRWLVQSGAAWTRLDSDRQYSDVEKFDPENPPALRLVRHDQSFDVLTLDQSWAAELGQRQGIELGWTARRYNGSYLYSRRVTDIPQVPDDLRFLDLNGSYDADVDSDQQRYGLYLTDRVKLGSRFVLEAGLRFDHDDFFEETEISPRLNGVLDLESNGILRFAAGRFRQAHRINELSIPDGDLGLYPDEVSDLVQLGYQQSFAQDRWNFRAEAYRREVDDPRPHYQNLFDAFTPFPELESDRVRWQAESAESEGLELFLSFRGEGQWGGWISYVTSSTVDIIEGREVPRYFDQTHAVTLDVQYRPSQKWSWNAVWVYHTGWPTTAVSLAIDAENEPFLVVGKSNDARLPAYHRLDIRISRQVERRRGKLLFFLDVQNLYDRENIRGYEFEPEGFDIGPNRQLILEENDSFGLLPSLGVSWEF